MDAGRRPFPAMQGRGDHPRATVSATGDVGLGPGLLCSDSQEHSCFLVIAACVNECFCLRIPDLDASIRISKNVRVLHLSLSLLLLQWDG